MDGSFQRPEERLATLIAPATSAQASSTLWPDCLDRLSNANPSC